MKRVFKCIYEVGKYNTEVEVDVIIENAAAAKAWCRNRGAKKIVKCVEVFDTKPIADFRMGEIKNLPIRIFDNSIKISE